MSRNAAPPSRTDALRSPARRVVFVVTEDWFFVSHFLPMVRAAREAGCEPVVVTRIRQHRAAIEAAGARVVPFEAERGSLNPLHLFGTIRDLAAILRREAPAIVHAIALRSIVVAALAARLSGTRARVFALTGLGFLGARGGRVVRSAVHALRLALLSGPGARFVFENRSDPRMLGLDPDRDPRVTILGGAGVDPEFYRPQTLADGGTLKVAIISRMLWSKGIDVAVDAVRIARAEGVDVTLTLFGTPDPSNPRSIDEATLSRWSREAGISWAGATRDVPAVWRDHHVACLPSRGGEGLPRTLLEAAACGRALVTTDVPGCRDLVRDGVEGLVVPVNEAAELARAFATLASDRWMVETMGAAAARRILDGHTEAAVVATMTRLYRSLAGEPAGR